VVAEGGADEFVISVDETDFLTLDPIPEILRRSVVPLALAYRTDEGAAVIEPIGTAFVISRLASGQALLATADHNVEELRIGSKLVILLPKSGTTEGGLQGLAVSGTSRAQSSSDVALLTAPIDDSVATPMLIPLSLEIPQVGENCLALGYSELVIGEPVGLEARALFRLSSSRGRIEEVHPSRRDPPAK
jgi:hypothetical protein